VERAIFDPRSLRAQGLRRIATRYDRCAHTFMSAICIAATVIFWFMSPERLAMKALGAMHTQRLGIGHDFGVGRHLPGDGWRGGGLQAAGRGQAGERLQRRAMLWARACQRSTALTFSAAHQKADEAAVAGLGVDVLGGGGALPVDRLGVVAAHAAAPLGDGGRVARQGRVRVAPGARGWRRGADRHALPGEGVDVVELGEAAVDEMLARPPAVGSQTCSR
jgi:hypothetical protein